MQLKAVTMAGASMTLTLPDDGSATILDVKKAIFSQNDSIPVESIGLIHAGKRPGNEVLLTDFGIPDGGTFHIVRLLKSMTSLNVETEQRQKQQEQQQQQQQQQQQSQAQAQQQAQTQGQLRLPAIGQPQAQPQMTMMPQQQPQQQQQGMVLSTTVPNGSGPGQLVQVRTPDGRMVQVAVPQGCMPGMSFQFQVPPPPQPQPRQMVVTCPHNVMAGGLMQVAVGGGKIVTVRVPMGIRPGMQFRIVA